MSVPETAVSSSPKQWGCSKMNVARITYDWTITEFSLRPEDVRQKVISPAFYSGSAKIDEWRLELYPRGDDDGNKDHLSLFLKLMATEKPEIPLQCKFSILKTSTNTKTNMKKFFRKYQAGTVLGYPCFIARTHLLDKAQGLLTDDTLVICCEIDIPTDTITTSWVDDGRKQPKQIPKRRLVDDLQVLLDNSNLSDVKIIVEDNKFNAHKLILASRSPVFDAMFKQSMEDESLVQIDDLRADVVKGMLQFIYTDEAPDLENMVEEYLGAAEKFQLGGLKGKCGEVILERVNDETAAGFLVVADHFKAEELKAKVMSYIMSHLPRVVRSEGYKELEKKHPVLLGEIIRAQVTLMEQKAMASDANCNQSPTMRARNPALESPVSFETSRTTKRGIRRISMSDVKRLRETWEWTIQDFQNLPEGSGESIQSGVFATGADRDNKDKWYLDLYPGGRDKDCSDYFSLYLMLKSTKHPELQVHLQLSIVKAGTKEKFGVKEAHRKFVSGMSVGWRHFIKRKEIFSNVQDFLANNELRISCEFNYEIKSGERSSDLVVNDLPVVKDLWLCFEQSKFSDCAIIVGKKTFHSHKMILAARSPTFCRMIEETCQERKGATESLPRLHVEDMKPEVARRMLQFIYTGSVENLEAMTEELMAAADRFRLVELKDICAAALLEKLSVKNAADTLVKADKCHAKELKAQVISFINEHLGEVVESSGYKRLEQNHLELLRDLLRAQAAGVKAKETEGSAELE
ncbi:protein roadkill [Diachasma alloeum]|uniref:protein roadkill n=1 Tax=Diachasma alloeum TaxID=454923 RepID=UPI0007384245|nr:protein roadkill [Diachasma alloeum]